LVKLEDNVYITNPDIKDYQNIITTILKNIKGILGSEIMESLLNESLTV